MLAAITLSPFLLMAALLPPVHAEIYRCTGKGGLAVYQNFPCDIDRLAVSPANAASRQPRAQSPARGPSTSREKPPAPAAPRVGMTTDEVRTIWGEPNDSSKEEFAKRDIEIWTYADSRTVEFDSSGRVTRIHW